jgi:hypothetical protein
MKSFILKACKAFISVPLSYLCNRVLFEGIFPDRLSMRQLHLYIKEVLEIFYPTTDLFLF